jgi:hypothetical protein
VTAAIAPSPRISAHAATRCAEMGISTKIPKAIVRLRTATWPARSGRRIVVSDERPELAGFAVVLEQDIMDAAREIVVTVLYRTPDEWVRR